MTAAQESQIKFNQKLAYLRRLLTLRVKFMRLVDEVEVKYIEEADTIEVTWFGKPGLKKKISFLEMIEFPASHLGRRIRHYKAKFRAEFNDRHKVLQNDK